MKISRIPRIRNHRIFRDFSWPRDLPDFSRFNLIYGWNGSGKTSLSDLFKVLAAKQPIANGEYEFQVDQQSVKSGSVDSATLPEIRVFNRSFIDASLFETVGKHFSPIYFLGEDSIEKQKQVEALRTELTKAEVALGQARSKNQAAISDHESFCTDKARLVKELLTGPGSPYNNYDKRGFKDAISNLTKETYASFLLDDQQKVQLRESKDGKPKPKISPVRFEYPDLAALTDAVRQLLEQSVVSRVLDELARDPALATWVSTGLSLHSGEHHSENCRFCGQTLTKERVQSLEGHFNDDFKRFQQELSSLMARIEDAKKQIDVIQLPESSMLYEHLVKDYEGAISGMTLHRQGVMQYLDALLRALAAKRESPFEAVALLPFFGLGPSKDGEPVGVLGTIFSVVMAGTGVWGAMQGRESLNKIQSAIDAHNTLTDNHTAEINKARKRLEQSYVAEAFEEYCHKKEAVDACKATEDSAVKTEKELRDKIAVLLREIRQHHRPAAELTQEIRAYLNRDELAFATHENGYSLTRNGFPATHLSEGERTSIAFLYFLKSLQDTGFDLANGIVVIDDPVSSLDENALYSAFGFMKDRTKDAGQLFVLTHNFAFFRLVKNWFNHLNSHKRPPKPAEFFMLACDGLGENRKSALVGLDPLLKDYESEYHYLFKCVHSEANRTDGQATLGVSYPMPNLARRVLEAFLAFRVPGTAKDFYKRLEAIDFDSAKKARIQRFVDTHSHFMEIGEPEHDLSVLSETRPVLQDVMALIERNDPEHFRQMLALVGEQNEQAEVAA
jgi:wobble nucleotide-excising tRNase